MATNGNDLNGLSKKRQETAQNIIKALMETRGLLTMAARRAGVSYSTVKRYAVDFPSVKQAVEDAKEGMLDFAEGKLFTQIDDGNLTAIIFYLKTQGKARGYTERQEITGEGGKPIKAEITVVSENARQLTQEILEGKGTE